MSAQQHGFTLLSSREGLPINMVSTLFQDRDGYMWAGTFNGVARYNGTRFEAFTVEDGLYNDSVHRIAQDSAGEFWFATNGGLSHWNGSTFTNYIPPFVEEGVSDMILQEDGTVWCATHDGLVRFQNGTFFEPLSGLPKGRVTAMTRGEAGEIWVGTEAGLFRLKQGKITPHPSAPTEPVSVLAYDRTRLWVGFSDRLQVYRNGVLEATYGEEQGVTGLPIRGMGLSSDGTVWLGTLSGLLSIKDDQVRVITQENGLPISLVKAIFEDREGMIWVGGTLGAAIFSGRIFSNYTMAQGLSGNGIRCLHRDREDNLWVGLFTGLSRMDRNENWNHFGVDEGLEDRYVICLDEDPKGRIWVGTRAGAYLYDGKRFERVEGLPLADVDDIEFESDGTAWLSLRNRGPYRGRPGNFQQARIGGQNYERGRLLVDRNDGVWYSGTRGLSRLKDGKWVTYSTEDGLTANRPYYLYEDTLGRIWFSYHSSHGVSYYEEGKFTSYTTETGLHSGAVFTIGMDSGGKMWFGHADGLDSFDGKRFVNYSLLEGFAGTECNSGAFAESADGDLWIGTMSGLSRYHPDLDYVNEKPPAVAIQSASLGELNWKPGENMVGEGSGSRLEVQVAILSYVPRERIALRYRLNENGELWLPLIGNHVRIDYLEPGYYHLEVQGSKYGGDWSPSAVLDFRIMPPFWATLWFRGLLLLFLVGLVLGVSQYNVRSMQKQRVTLERTVAERTEALRHEIYERTRTQQALQAAQMELVEEAHKSGMAEIMIGVLHNIGNVLSSVGTSAAILEERLERSRVGGLTSVNLLLQQHRDNLPDFLENNPKGRQLLEYLSGLEQRLLDEHGECRGQVARIVEKVENIKAYITTHQSNARTGFFSEDLHLDDAFEEAVMIQSAGLEREGITLERHVLPTSPIRVQKSKLIHILVNLIKNSREAMHDSHNKVMRVAIYQAGDEVTLELSDTGCGIEKEQLEKIFCHGYTTKTQGFGFGLHSCANYMTEMKGRMWANSDGKGHGASFFLRFPVSTGRRTGEMPRFEVPE